MKTEKSKKKIVKFTLKTSTKSKDKNTPFKIYFEKDRYSSERTTKYTFGKTE